MYPVSFLLRKQQDYSILPGFKIISMIIMNISKKKKKNLCLVSANIYVFNVICFNIRLEKLTKLNKNACKKITYFYFVLIDFYMNY